MVKIQEITNQMFESFYRCFESLMQEGYACFPPELKEYFIKKEYTLNNFILWCERKFRIIFLALDDQQRIIGFLVGDNSYGGVAFITWVGILPEYRKMGIGNQLLKTYEDHVKAKNAHLIELFTYDGVKGFYEKNGFVEIGRREQGFFGQTNIIMNKKIGNWDIKNIPPIY